MERMLVSGSPYFRRHGINGTVIGQGSENPFAPQLVQAGYEVRLVPSLRSLRGLRSLRHLLRDLRPDLVHIHTEGSYLETAMISYLAHIPAVRTIHNVFQRKGLARAKRKVRGLMADRLVKAVMAPSPDVLANEKGLGRKCILIYNWVDDKYFTIARQVRKDSIVIVGNCSSIKNHETVLNKALMEGLSVFHHGDETHASYREKELLGNLDALGLLLERGSGDPVLSYSQAEAFVMPSLHEGMPVSLAEAITVGLPCLVADVPGLSWALKLPSVVSLSPEPLRVQLDRLSEMNDAGLDFSATRGVSELAQTYWGAIGS